MKFLIANIIIIGISIVFATLTTKRLRKNLEGQFIYHSDTIVTWTIAWWGMIYFVSQFFGDIFEAGAYYRSFRMLSGSFIFIFTLTSLYLTYRRVVVSSSSVTEKRIFFKDRVVDRQNLESISDYRYKGKNYLQFLLKDGKHITVWDKNINIQKFTQSSNSYKDYKKLADLLPGPMFDEQISYDTLSEVNLSIENDEPMDINILSQFEETITAGDELSFYDAQVTLTIIGILIASLSSEWAKYNLPSYPRLDFSDDPATSKKIFAKAHEALIAIKEGDNEWNEMTNGRRFSYVRFDLNEMISITDMLANSLEISSYAYPKERLFDRMIEISKGFGFSPAKLDLFTENIQKAKSAYLANTKDEMKSYLELAMDVLLDTAYNRNIGVEIVRLMNL